MKKYVWIVALIAAFALVFVGCGGGDSDPNKVKDPDTNNPDTSNPDTNNPDTNNPDTNNPDTNNPGGIPPQADNVVRFLYSDGTYLDIQFEAGETRWGDITSSKAYKRKGGDKWTDYSKIFVNWKDQTGADWTSGTAVINTKLTLTGKFLDNVVTDDGTATEKLQLENAGQAIYKFTIPGGSTLADYKEFQVTYKITEYAIGKLQTRHRVYGQFGTFATQEDTTGGAFDSSSVDGYQTDENGVRFVNAPKFNVGAWIFLANDAGGNNSRDLPFTSATLTNNLVDGTITADTWFTLKYDITVPYGAGAANNPLTATGDVYYSLGLTTNSDPRNGDTYVPNFAGNNAPILQLVKNIKLIHTSDPTKNITATIPGATEAQFMAYATPGSQVFCWRGAPSAAVNTPAEQPPPPLADGLATEDYVYVVPTAVDIALVGDTDISGVPKITVAGNKITYNLLVADNAYNNPDGAMGNPAGLKVVFEDLDLPEGYDYTCYESIVIDITAANLEGSASNPNQVNIRKINGTGQYTNINGSNNFGTASGYIGLTNGTNTISFPTSSLVMQPDNTPGFRIVPNNYQVSNLPWKGELTINSITFVSY